MLSAESFLQKKEEPCPWWTIVTGQKLIRGVLCIKCNTGIGQLRDSVEVVANALRYLRDNKGIKPDYQKKFIRYYDFILWGTKLHKAKRKKTIFYL